MAFQKKLEYQQVASTPVARASNDDRLRRALLRKYRGNVQQLRIGQRCFYYRDLPQAQSALGPKITWRGPATVVMVEEENKLYWLAHGTSLIRAAYEHTRPLMDAAPLDEEHRTNLHAAKDALQAVRGRGVTQYLDLPKSNKRRLEELDTEDEKEEFDHDHVVVESSSMMLGPGLPDHPHGLKRPEISASDYAPSSVDGEPESKAPRAGDVSAQHDPTPLIPTHAAPTQPHIPQEPPHEVQPPPHASQPHLDEAATPNLESQDHVEDGSSAGRQRAGAGGSRPAAGENPYHSLDTSNPFVAPAHPESFQARRSRYDRQETLFYKPALDPKSTTNLTRQVEAPYGERPLKDTSVEEALLQEVEVEILKTSHLPLGWTTDETGHMVLGPIQDEWKLEGSHLVRYHYMPRNSRFTPEVDDCPIPLDHLSKHQESYDGNNRRFDKWKNKETQRQVFGLATPASRLSPAIEDRPLSSSMLLVKDRPVMSQRRRKMTEASMNVI